MIGALQTSKLERTSCHVRETEEHENFVPAGVMGLVYFSRTLQSQPLDSLTANSLDSNIRCGLMGAVGVFLGEVPAGRTARPPISHHE